MRKVWNPRAFKNHVSPHELVQEIARLSKKRFSLEKRMDPVDLLAYLLNTLHAGLGGTKKKSSIIHKVFQGELRIQSRTVIAVTSDKLNNQTGILLFSLGFGSSNVPFLFLTLDLPLTPVFSAEDDKSLIPQVSLLEMLKKFSGNTDIVMFLIIQAIGTEVKRFQILKLPKYLVFCFKRFSKNGFVEERNPTIVNFPLKNLDMSPCISLLSRCCR
jgi:U4/U6.U5 tri-snRNP-associated protein 2